jgi:uncharacterized glyoxalase superfamily protein PhnB
MKQSVSLITLGISDYERATSSSRRRQEVDDLLERAFTAGGTITRQPCETFYGGYAGAVRDLDGHAWEIAHNPGFVLVADRSVLLGERA